ncbi:MAG: DNA polymerase III subunit beta, partial [Eubacteriales bacterium]
MKFTCKKNDLLTGVNTVQRTVSNKSTLPILQGIKIETKNNNLIFEATDLEIGIHCEIPVTIIENGSVVLPAKLFSDIVRKLPDTEITIDSKEN